MENNYKIIRIKRIKLKRIKRFKGNLEYNKDRNLKHNSRKPIINPASISKDA